LELRGGRIDHVHHFVDPALFTRFGLPRELPPLDTAAPGGGRRLDPEVERRR
jgi:hypothetical protein